MELKIIAHIHTDFPEKFGIPRQSGLVGSLRGRIVFEQPYRVSAALRGLEGYSHLWLLWQFEDTERGSWSPTVRPPRLGGNKRVGVFASRSPFRPNPIGLSCVELLSVEETDEGPVLWVAGADLRDNTPIFDIKPYLPFADAHPEATGGFAAEKFGYALSVEIPEPLLALLPADKRDPLREILAQDPRPSYQDGPDRIYGFPFAGFEVKFQVSGDTLRVTDIAPEKKL